MLAANLTTLAAVKAYLGATVSTQDSLIGDLIPRASAAVERHCGRKFPSQTYTNKLLSGSGGRRLVLPGSPVVSVSAVQVGAAVLTASSDPLTQAGYAFDDMSIYLVGSVGGYVAFPPGLNNVRASWVAGYATSESGTTSSANTPTFTPTTDGNAAADRGVTYTANGVALVSVTSNPLVGQYSFSSPTYTFNAADASKAVTASYYYVPHNVEQATIELVGLKLKQRTNIGVRSQGLAGESVVYEDRDMTPSVKRLLDPYVLRVYS